MFKKHIHFIMNKYHWAFITSLGLALTACSPEKGKFTVTGCITGANDSLLYLESINLDGIERMDSVRLTADGAFKFNGPAPTDGPDFYALRIGGKRMHFVIDSAQTVQFKADYKTITSSYEVSGNESSVKIRDISLKQQLVQKRIIDIEKNESLLPGDASDCITNILNAFKTEIKQKYIYQAPASAYAYFAVCQSISDLYGSFQLFNPLTNRDDVKCYAIVATSWTTFWPQSLRTKQLSNMAERGMANTAPKQTTEVKIDASKLKETGLIDITLPDIESRQKSLSSLYGKAVLLDFTIYEAPQSAKRTRILRSIYDRYHSQGLEIYQVSLDEDVHYWKQACEQLPWVCVHETDGTASRLYAVTDLPTFFLIDRNGNVVKRSDAVRNLEAEIADLL